MSLVVVVPCFRQEAFLTRTLAALERALDGEVWEGVLVMSEPGGDVPRHSDRWTLIAPPVTSPLTPGAARMLGFAARGGDRVLFVDADVEVDAAWVRAAIDRLSSEAGLAGVWGRLEEWFVDAEGERPGAADLLRVGTGECDVEYMTAVALYRREALLRAGGYDARLRSEEDFELGMRLRQLGYRMRSLGQRAGRHWSAPRPSLGELARRWRSGLCFGQGQVLRLYLGRRGFLTVLKRQTLYVTTLLLWVAGVVAAVHAVRGGSPVPLVAWATLVLAAFTLMAVRKRSMRLAMFSILTWTVNGLGVLVGLVRGLERPFSLAGGRRA